MAAPAPTRSRWPIARSILGGAPVKMISGMADAGDLIKVNSTGNLVAGDMILVAPHLARRSHAR